MEPTKYVLADDLKHTECRSPQHPSLAVQDTNQDTPFTGWAIAPSSNTFFKPVAIASGDEIEANYFASHHLFYWP